MSFDVIEGSDKFIELFKEFEETIRNKCIENGINSNDKIKKLVDELAEKNNIVKKHKNDIDDIRVIRNLNTHNYMKNKDYKYFVFPSPEVNLKLRKIIDEINEPTKIYDTNMYVKKENIYFKTMDSNIYSTIKDMIEKVYTHIPILDDGKIIGVFSENSLLDIANSNGKIKLDEYTKFYDIKEILKIQNHSTEEFIFVSKRKKVYEIEELFKDYFNNKKRIACIYITENGKENEKVLGMLTAWDVLGRNKK